MLAWDAIKSVFSGWYSKWKQQKEVSDAVEPYKKELAIKERPAGSDDDIIGRL